MKATTILAEAEVRAVAAGVLASLPVSYTPGDQAGHPDVVVVAGSGSWPAQVQTSSAAGSRAAVVVHPHPADLAALLATGATVVLDSIWAGNPAVGGAAAYFIEAASKAQLVECGIVLGPGRSPAASLADAATLLRALVGPLTSLQVLQHDEQSFVATGNIGELSVSVSLLTTTGLAPHAYVRALTDDGGVEIAIPHPSTARPAEVVITDEAGVRTLPTLWESGHRTAWRRAHALLQVGDPGPDLSEFAADQVVLHDALGHLLATTSSPTNH